jgi:Icc-related predicted phosphoesterase
MKQVESIEYKVVAKGGRNEAGMRVEETVRLPIYFGSLSCSNFKTIEYLIITSDLQGVIYEDGKSKLLGEVLPAYLKMVFELELDYTKSEKIGVILCGDLYANADKRGGIGDVRNVWRAFNAMYKFVVGVAGNHDAFGDNMDINNFRREEGIHFLDNQVIKIDGVRFGGLGGIIGDPKKPNRVNEADYLIKLKNILLRQPEFVLLHESPSNQNESLAGNYQIEETIYNSPANVIICGHTHWDNPSFQKVNRSTILNTDAKCYILKIIDN